MYTPVRLIYTTFFLFTMLDKKLKYIYIFSCNLCSAYFIFFPSVSCLTCKQE